MGWTHDRARVAALSRHRPADDLDLADAVTELRTERLADHIREVVESAPAPSPEQIERLRGLLPPVPTPQSADAA
jgi:hypothetical protein